jgi:hypothetical protein
MSRLADRFEDLKILLQTLTDRGQTHRQFGRGGAVRCGAGPKILKSV